MLTVSVISIANAVVVIVTVIRGEADKLTVMAMVVVGVRYGEWRLLVYVFVRYG